MRKKEEIIILRTKVKELLKEGLSNSEISRKLGVTRDFVIKWKTNKSVQSDKRGWKKGKKRKHSDEIEKEIVRIRKNLQANSFFIGATAVKQKLESTEKISLSFIKRIIKDKNLQTQKKKNRGKSEYQLYPKN